MRQRIRMLVPALLVLAGMVLALPAWAATNSVDLTADNRFAPGSLSIAVGDTVQFNWQGGFHDVVFADGTSSGAPTADLGMNFSRTFNSTGTFSYICTVHEALGMTGTITVTGAAGGTGTTVAGSVTGTSPNVARQMPSTGPEEGVLPLVGGILAAMGLVGLVIVRRMAA